MLQTGLFGWANLIMNAVSRWRHPWQLFHLRREITALVRVERRIDRKTPDDHRRVSGPSGGGPGGDAGAGERAVAARAARQVFTG
jgi:hypothetical protein